MLANMLEVGYPAQTGEHVTNMQILAEMLTNIY